MERRELQLTIDGREEPIADAVGGSAPFTAAQREILRLLAERNITPADAGRIVHLHRAPPCDRCERGACGFVGSDGSDALKRLKERALARRLCAGVWTARR